jgi:uncharacterized protein YjiK
MNRFFLIAIAATIIFSCNKDDDPALEKLTLLRQYDIAVAEPSGLSYSAGGNALYTVSDQTGNAYKLSLTGSVISTLGFTGNDLEGITVNPSNGDIWVVAERSRQLIKLKSNGTEIDRFQLDIEANDDNAGLEGIAFNSENDHLYILNEKNPGLLLEVNEQGKIVRETELNFASDYSGIFFDHSEEVLWIVSDESKTVTKCDLFGELDKSFNIPIAQAEGIVVNSQEKEIYLTRDGNSKMYIFGY